MLKELRTKHQEPSFLSGSSSRVIDHPTDVVNSPVFSPFSNLEATDQSNIILSVSRHLSGARSSRRDSLGSVGDPFDRYIHSMEQNTLNHGQEDSHDDLSRYPDDSRMSIDSSPSIERFTARK